MRDLAEAARTVLDAYDNGKPWTDEVCRKIGALRAALAAHDAAASATLEEICEGVAELRQENERLRKALVAAQSEQRAKDAEIARNVPSAPHERELCNHIAAAIEGQTP